MCLTKKLFVCFVLFTLPIFSFAKDIKKIPLVTTEARVFAKNSNGQDIKQPQIFVLIPEYGFQEKTDSDGIIRFKIPEVEYTAGKRILFQVLKEGWRIAYPPNGVAILPRKNGMYTIPIILEVDKRFSNVSENYVYTVQAMATLNETIAQQKANHLTHENKQKAFVEKYPVSNMPENGFIYKVKIGEFYGKNAKEDAEKFSFKLDRKYKEINGFFVTLKGYK